MKDNANKAILWQNVTLKDLLSVDSAEQAAELAKAAAALTLDFFVSTQLGEAFFIAAEQAENDSDSEKAAEVLKTLLCTTAAAVFLQTITAIYNGQRRPLSVFSAAAVMAKTYHNELYNLLTAAASLPH